MQSGGCVEFHNPNLKGESFPVLIINLNLRYKHGFVTVNHAPKCNPHNYNAVIQDVLYLLVKLLNDSLS